jgi:hypothetical protein
VDEQTLALLASFAAPAIVAGWLWWSKIYLPARQKQDDDEAIHHRRREDSDQSLGEGISEKLLAHIITLTDGQYSSMRRELNDKLDLIIASQNQTIVFMSRNQAALPIIGHVADWTDPAEIAAAAITSAAEKNTASVVEASVKKDGGE